MQYIDKKIITLGPEEEEEETNVDFEIEGWWGGELKGTEKG